MKFVIQDPYLILFVGQEKYRSTTHKGGGKNPQWQGSYTFQGQDQLMRVQCWDEDTFGDDLIG